MSEAAASIQNKSAPITKINILAKKKHYFLKKYKKSAVIF
jgi:hypothetical protein